MLLWLSCVYVCVFYCEKGRVKKHLPQLDLTIRCLIVPAFSFANGMESDSVLELLDYKKQVQKENTFISSTFTKILSYLIIHVLGVRKKKEKKIYELTNLQNVKYLKI